VSISLQKKQIKQEL